MARSTVLLAGFLVLTPLAAHADDAPAPLAVKLTLSDKAPGESGLVPLAANELLPAGRLYCEYEVTGAVPEGQSLEGAFVLRTMAGQVVASSTPRPLAPKADGRIWHRMAVP